MSCIDSNVITKSYFSLRDAFSIVVKCNETLSDKPASCTFLEAFLMEEESASIASILTMGNSLANAILAQPSPHPTSRTCPPCDFSLFSTSSIEEILLQISSLVHRQNKGHLYHF